MALPTEIGDERHRLVLTALLLSIAGWGLLDLALDWPQSPHPLHLAVEVVFVGLCLASTAWLWSGWMGARRGLRRIEDELARNQAERERWRARATKLLEGLGAEIDAQFERWALTPAERQVALLLLKGLGHKEVASVLGRSERTVRQHAVAVYRKSGLAGRAELSAFFLEDLLLPSTGADDPGREAGAR